MAASKKKRTGARAAVVVVLCLVLVCVVAAAVALGLVSRRVKRFAGGASFSLDYQITSTAAEEPALYKVLAQFGGTSGRVDGQYTPEALQLELYPQASGSSQPLTRLYISKDETLYDAGQLYRTLRSSITDNYPLAGVLIPEWNMGSYISQTQLASLLGVDDTATSLQSMSDFQLDLKKIKKVQPENAKAGYLYFRLETDDTAADAPVLTLGVEKSGLLRAASPAVHILLDSSGSMGGAPMILAGQACFAVASALHAFSGRKGAYIPLNCAAIPETLFESELFGSRRGAFHEAADKPGKLELATGGTLFLDEVADMALTLQPKLLRFLENGEVTRLGDTRAKKLDVRVVTATNRDVAALIAANRFRDDLFQRLSCFTLHVPPLRERLEDIEPLSRYFLGRFAREYNWPEPRLADSALQALCRCQWPGNVRQLRNVLLRLAVQAQGRQIGEREVLVAVDGPGGPEPARVAAFPTLEEMERQHLRHALERAGGNISDAAALAGIARSTFYQKMKKYDISAG